MQPLGYVPALDGIRALAIVLVMLFHCRVIFCGWIGVQVFFVLSGFLITSILVSDADLPLRLYLFRFYWRRSLRIFPLYFGYLAAMALFYRFTGEPASLSRLWPSLLTYTLNFEHLKAGMPNDAYFGHLWSLAVEEQFYAFWPLLIYVLRPNARRVMAGALLLLCPLVRAWTADFAAAKPDELSVAGHFVYCFTPAQLDSFATGAMLVFLKDRMPRNPIRWLALVTLVVLAAGQAAYLASLGRFGLNTSLGYPVYMIGQGRHVWGYTLLNLWSAALILVAMQPNAVSRCLSHSGAVFLGTISYGMYVLHPALLKLVFELGAPIYGLRKVVCEALFFVVAVAACYCSFRFYERPIIEQKNRLFQRPEREEKPADQPLRRRQAV